MDQAKEKFAKLQSKVDWFMIMMVCELAPSKSTSQRANSKLEMLDFDLDQNPGVDYFTSGEGQEGELSLTTSWGTPWEHL